jgi:chromosome segregation ATPase
MATVGVKVELEGAKAFSDGMKNLSAQTKLFDTEIKNIQKSMSKSAFQKSIQEGEALKGKLSALEKESELLQKRIADMSQAYGENDTRVIQLKQKYEALQGQIERTNQALQDNGGYFGALGKEFEAIGSKLDEIGSKISSVGDSLTKSVTAPILAVGTASVVHDGSRYLKPTWLYINSLATPILYKSVLASSI